MNTVQKISTMTKSEATTYEGGKAYAMSFESTLAEFFSLGLLNGNFYQSQAEVLKDARELFERALVQCPEYATKCAVYGHEQNKLRLVPTVWLVYVSRLEDKTLFERAFPRIISTFDMLWDFVEICRKGGVRGGLGRNAKKVVNDRFVVLLNEFQACRYKNTISEISKVTRPYSEDETFQKLMKYVAKDEASFERIVALKAVIDAMNEGVANAEVLKKIKKCRLQLEELKHATGKLSAEDKQSVYSTLYSGLKYSALVRNLVALERVFATNTYKVNKYREGKAYVQTLVTETDIPTSVVDMVSERLSDFNEYKRCNMLPFALLTAERMSITPEFKAALGKMLRNAAESTFAINKLYELMVAVDTSRSMEMYNVNDSVTCMDAATLYGALIKKAHANTRVFAVAEDMEEVLLNKQDDVFDMASQIEQTDVGAGTEFEQIMTHYSGQKYVILITDEQQADNLEKEWLRNTNKPEGAKLIVWKLLTTGTTLSKDSSVVHVYGFSDGVLSLVKNVIEDKAGQAEVIKAIVL